VTKGDWKEFYGLILAADDMMRAGPRGEAAISLMFSVLSDYGMADVRAAVGKHVKGSPYPVKPADIVSLIDGAPDERSLLAWETFLRAAERYGCYDSVRFPDPAYHYAIQHMGGWERLSEELHRMTDKEIQFRSRDWRRLYEAGLRIAAWGGERGKERVPEYLWGFFERDNREKNRLDCLPEVIMIGGAEDAPALPEPASASILVMPGRGAS
jgi:hypothetical protein